VSTRGQALVELALALPVLLILVLGTVAVTALVADQAALDQATSAAAAAAARAPDIATAVAEADDAFSGVLAAYRLASPSLELSGTPDRGSRFIAVASATAILDVPIVGIPTRIRLASRSGAVVEPWRSRP
jgi:Flp pilus assembly protein TadG